MNKFFSSRKVYMYCTLTALCFLMLGLWWPVVGVAMFATGELVIERTLRPPSRTRRPSQIGSFLKSDPELSMRLGKGFWMAGLVEIAVAVVYFR